MIYTITESKWLSQVQFIPKKVAITVVPNEKGDLVAMRSLNGWRLCMYYQKLNSCPEKNHFPMPFIDHIVDRISKRGLYFFFMDILAITKSVLLWNTKRKQCLCIHMVIFHSNGCRLVKD